MISQAVNTYIGPKYQVHSGVVTADKDRVFVNMLRKIKAGAVFHQVKTSADSAGFATKSNIAWNVQHLVLLAKNCLFTYNLNVGAEIIGQAASHVGPSFVDVVVFESEYNPVISSEPKK